MALSAALSQGKLAHKGRLFSESSTVSFFAPLPHLLQRYQQTPGSQRQRSRLPISRAISISACTPSLSSQPSGVNTTTSSHCSRCSRSTCCQNAQSVGSPCST